MKVNLLADLFYANWELWQDILIILFIVIAIGLLFYGIAFLFIYNARTEGSGKRMAKRAAWYERQLDIKRRALDPDNDKGSVDKP